MISQKNKEELANANKQEMKIENEYLGIKKRIFRSTYDTLSEIADKVGVSTETMGAIWIAINENRNTALIREEYTYPENLFYKRGYLEVIEVLADKLDEDSLIEAVTFAGGNCCRPAEMLRSILLENTYI